jgi:hypothetical protein
MTVDSFNYMGQFNIEWNSGFRTTAGNGFVSRDPTFPYVGGPRVSLVFDNPDYFSLIGSPFWIEMNQEEADELIGSVVTSATGSFTLTAAYLTDPGQDVSASGYTDPPTSIDKLTPF